MDREFWKSRWDEGRIGFHQEEINPYLPRYWPRLASAANAPVFVPLCGKSKDMLWLRDRGHSVIGVEIVPRAVEAFFAENDIQCETYQQDDFTVWEGEGVKIHCGDFFELGSADVADVAGVYDRASLIALPPALRTRYAQHLRAILPRRAGVLLITMDYPQAEMQGPPFAVEEGEVAALYQNHFAIEQACADDILASNPRFREQGLTCLQEKVYILKPRERGSV